MTDIAEQKSSLGHVPETPRWEFDRSVTDVFDDMLERSIPQYRIMRELTFDIGREFVQPKTEIVDLGCSRGEAIEPFMRTFGAHNRYLGVEVSEPMLDEARQRFASWPESVVRIENLDLRTDYPEVDASLTLCVLTLMFTPINYRRRIMANIARTTRYGGAVILVEKLIGENDRTDRIMVDRYHRMKAENGYTQEEIDRKALALEGVQVPVSASWNEDLLRDAGFGKVECFWRWMNFAGWIGIRG